MVFSYFNSRKSLKLFLRKGSARVSNYIEAGDVITGYSTGAYATVSSIDDEAISYFQPQVFTNNSIKTSTSLTLYNGSAIDKSIEDNGNVYTTNLARSLKSLTNIVKPDGTVQDFKIRVAMTNNGFQSASPIVDADISMINAYKYNITSNTSTSSNWITKEVILAEKLDATGLKVLLSAFRPAGTMIDVYVRFVYPTNVDVQSSWVQLANAYPEMYSNSSNTKDYREFEYNLTEADPALEYSTFQVKFVLRHATTTEINSSDLTVTPAVNLFPHLYDYRAIALT